MPGRNISKLLNLIYFENLFRDIGFSSSYCFVPVYQPFHPSIELGNQIITRKNEHKHLGVILDSKLNFQLQVREAVIKARKGIGLIKYLSKYVSTDVLDQVYKLYVRPHLDYGDIIYHKFDPDMRSTVTKSIEQVQYTAALAVTGAWKGTSRQKIYEEL